MLAQPELADPADRERVHRPGTVEAAASTSVLSAVSESTRSGLRTAHSKPIGPPMS